MFTVICLDTNDHRHQYATTNRDMAYTHFWRHMLRNPIECVLLDTDGKLLERVALDDMDSNVESLMWCMRTPHAQPFDSWVVDINLELTRPLTCSLLRERQGVALTA